MGSTRPVVSAWEHSPKRCAVSRAPTQGSHDRHRRFGMPLFRKSIDANQNNTKTTQYWPCDKLRTNTKTQRSNLSMNELLSATRTHLREEMGIIACESMCEFANKSLLPCSSWIRRRESQWNLDVPNGTRSTTPTQAFCCLWRWTTCVTHLPCLKKRTDNNRNRSNES